MLKCRSIGAILAIAIVFVSPVSAEVMHPIGNWILDYRDDQCLASRNYGGADKPLTLGIRPAPNGETYELLVAQPRRGPDYAIELKGQVNFGRGAIQAWLLSYAAKASKSDVYQFRITATEMSQALSAQTVTVSAEGAPNLVFALDSVPALLKGLKDCTDDLQKYWNADGEKTGLIVKPARGDVRSVFTSDDYPEEASNRSQEGKAQFLLLIDEKGHVAGCHVLLPSGVPTLDAVGCQVIRQRAVFTPARGRDGKPIRSTVITPPVVWSLQ